MSWRLLGLLFLSNACGMASSREAAAPAAASHPEPRSAPGVDAGPTVAAKNDAEVVRTVSLEGEETAPSEETAAPVAPTPAAAPPPAAAARAAVREGVMLDIQANLEVQVADVRRAVAALRKSVSAQGGFVTQESITTGESSEEVRLTLRVPAASSGGTISAIEGLGEVTVHTMTAEDVGKQYYDAQVALANLEVTLARYQQILERATKVDEVLIIEEHLARVRGEIERIKGELRFLRDRSAKATIRVTLRSVAAEAPEAAFHPGVRATYLLDFRGEQGDDGYFGGGVSVRVVRALSLELDALRRIGSDTRGIDGLLLTIGGDFYSKLAGGGERRSLNPYLGYRLGYARLPEKEDAFVVGGVVGLELLRTRVLSLDADVSGLGFLGDRHAHFAIQPALTANFAF